MTKDESVTTIPLDSDGSISKSNLPYPHKPVGVGGFLKFFAIFVCVILPVLSGISNWSEFTSVENNYPDIVNFSEWVDIKTTSYSTWLIQLFIFWYICNTVYSNTKKNTKWKIIGLLWLAGPFVAIGSMLSLIVVASDPFRSTMLSEGMVSLFASTFWVIIWTLYFLLSKRVANTYRVK